jgi:hypothetical protein
MKNSQKILLIVLIIGIGLIPVLSISNLGINPESDSTQTSGLEIPVQTPIKISLVESMEMRNP